MTAIEKALAEALRKPMMANGLDSTANQGYHGWRCEHVDRYGPCECFDELVRDLAVDVAATEPMQAIVRQAAIGAAVERLEAAEDVVAWEVSSGYERRYWTAAYTHREKRTGEADTLPAAIAAALELDR